MTPLDRLKSAVVSGYVHNPEIIRDLRLVLELIDAADDMPDCDATQKYRYDAEFNRLQAALKALTESANGQ